MKLRPAALTGLIVLVGALPLLVTRPAPLQDWPNHLARIHILIGLLHGDPFWERFYRLSGFWVPNAAMDVSILGLTRTGLSVAVAGQVFLTGVYLLFLAGFYALAGALQASDSVKPALGVLLFYGYALFWGLVNYVLGVGLLLGLLAAWMAAERWPGRRLAIAGGGAVLLLFTHVVPAVVWIAVLGCFDLTRFVRSSARPGRRLLESASWLLALAVVGALLRALPGGTGHDLAAGYSGHGLAAIVTRKLLLFGKVLLGGSTLQDAASLAALLVAVAAVLAARPRIAAAPAFAIAGLVGLTLAAPEHIGTGSLLDQRLSILPLIFAAAAVRMPVGPSRSGNYFLSPETQQPSSSDLIRPSGPAPSSSWRDRMVGSSPTMTVLTVRWSFSGWLGVRPPSASWTTAAVLLRTLVLAWQFHAAGLVFRDFRQRWAGLPPGSVMLMAYGTPLPSLSWAMIWSPPITSIATQVVFRGIFVPHVFANPAQQPMALRNAFQDLTQPWDLTDAAHLRATAAALAPLCAEKPFAGVYLTVLYPGPFISAGAGGALLVARPHFLILDACRLPRQA